MDSHLIDEVTGESVRTCAKSKRKLLNKCRTSVEQQSKNELKPKGKSRENRTTEPVALTHHCHKAERVTHMGFRYDGSETIKRCQIIDQ